MRFNGSDYFILSTQENNRFQRIFPSNHPLSGSNESQMSLAYPSEIAKELIVSVHTAKAHVCSILQKMCVNDRVQAAVKAVKEGLV